MTTTSEHWERLAEFSKLEIQAGGPDPHMKVVGYMGRNETKMERLWRGGIYVGVYNVPVTEAIWLAWSWPFDSPGNLAFWIEDNWAGIKTRPERRCVRTPKKLSRFLIEYAEWLKRGGRKKGATPEESYEILWKSLDEVTYMGRYAKFKILEYMERYCELPICLPDIRPRGAWSPRATLALLFPEHEEALNGKDTPENLEIANRLADQAIEQLRDHYDLDLNYYSLEVLLCDYRQLARRQYPGHSQDSELGYYAKVSNHWKHKTGMFAARKELFPHQHLGELNGWNGNRKELSYTLRDHDYLWSDSLFDYQATNGNLAEPVPQFIKV